MTNLERSHSREPGYSLLEMLFALGLIALLSSMAILQINVSKPGLKGDGAVRTLLGQLNQARQSAIAQRRYVQVSLKQPNIVRFVREDTTTTTTTLPSVPIEGGVQFTQVSGVPDTDDKYPVIPFDDPVNNYKFSPDGTLVDKNGASVNATAFLGIPNQVLSARAVTILGSTGRIRGYKWNGTKWRPV
jgi:prepilin-type N-terminal cleavage/methylation domain-containing protein